ncbi:MAG: DUF72 domain-containing protein [Planctomycetota bacterium]|nr:DUF72 domain-containing protein [Planctomycetota bacterium]
MDPQMLLFADASLKKELTAHKPSDEWREYAQALPAKLHLGTSSWSVPGWEGIVYKHAKNERQLARQGLRPYAQNPLFSMVGIDRTYYAPVQKSVFESYAQSVPDAFRFMVKAHDHVTQARFPHNPRSGKRAGQLNDRFLDAEYATEFVVKPAVEGLKDKLGPLVFQFPPQSVRIMGGPQGFADRLFHFLTKLPKDVLYAVELRNAELLTQDYGDALFAAGASHCINVHPGFEAPELQIAKGLHLIGPALVIRWMLRRNLDYKSAVQRYSPFSQLQEPDHRTRELLVDLCRKERARDVFMTVNNKAEGCSPLSILEFAKSLVEKERAEE